MSNQSFTSRKSKGTADAGLRRDAILKAARTLFVVHTLALASLARTEVASAVDEPPGVVHLERLEA